MFAFKFNSSLPTTGLYLGQHRWKGNMFNSPPLFIKGLGMKKKGVGDEKNFTGRGKNAYI